MTMKILTNKKFRLLAFLILILGLLLGLKILSRRKAPKILETFPPNGEDQVLITPEIIVSFNQDLVAEEWIINPFPEFKFNLEIDKNQLKIVPTEVLKFQTKYNLEIKNKSFEDFYYSFSFTTIPQPITGLGDPTFHQRQKVLIQQNYPLLNYMPHRDEEYYLDYIDPRKLIVLFKEDTPQIRQKVLDWIESKGVDPSTHEIIWKVEEP